MSVTTTSTPNNVTSNAGNNTLMKEHLEGGIKNLQSKKNPFLNCNGGRAIKIKMKR